MRGQGRCQTAVVFQLLSSIFSGAGRNGAAQPPLKLVGRDSLRAVVLSEPEAAEPWNRVHRENPQLEPERRRRSRWQPGVERVRERYPRGTETKKGMHPGGMPETARCTDPSRTNRRIL